MNDEQILREISAEFGLVIKDNTLAKQLLVDKINVLITNDFNKLVSILYRMDISEPKLKQFLKENSTIDAGLIIADLMIQRQAEKIKSRQQFNKRDENISDDEKW